MIHTKPLQKPLAGKNFDLEPKDINSPNGKEIKRVMANSSTVLPNPLINLLNNISVVIVKFGIIGNLFYYLSKAM